MTTALNLWATADRHPSRAGLLAPDGDAFDLVPDAVTVERDGLTPTFKKKRWRILENRAERVQALFM